MTDKHDSDGRSARARLATLKEICRELVPLWLQPPPTPATLKAWFETARVRRLKANPSARHGGGRVYYDLGDVEKCLRGRLKQAPAAIPSREKPTTPSEVA